MNENTMKRPILKDNKIPFPDSRSYKYNPKQIKSNVKTKPAKININTKKLLSFVLKEYLIKNTKYPMARQNKRIEVNSSESPETDVVKGVLIEVKRILKRQFTKTATEKIIIGTSDLLKNANSTRNNDTIIDKKTTAIIMINRKNKLSVDFKSILVSKKDKK